MQIKAIIRYASLLYYSTDHDIVILSPCVLDIAVVVPHLTFDCVQLIKLMLNIRDEQINKVLNLDTHSMLFIENRLCFVCFVYAVCTIVFVEHASHIIRSVCIIRILNLFVYLSLLTYLSFDRTK